MVRFHDEGHTPGHTAATGALNPELLGDGLWSVPVPFPNKKHRYTRSGVLARPGSPLCIIDPGWETQESVDVMEGFLRSIGRKMRDVEFALLTHAHPDHIGLVPEIVRYVGAQVVMHPREFDSLSLPPMDDAAVAAQTVAWGVPQDHVATFKSAATGEWQSRAQIVDPILVEDGATTPIPGVDLEVVWTPGHTAGHICFIDAERSVLFSGDHVLPHMFPGIGLGGTFRANPAAEYLMSLEKLAPFDSFRVAPGHGSILHELKSRRKLSKAHVEKRLAEVAHIVRMNPDATVFAIAARVSWSRGWSAILENGLLAVALGQIHAYRDLFIARNSRPGRASCTNPAGW